MTPQEFLDEFGTLAESAEGVPKLREMVLDLAVRGTLVPQDTSDEPASSLLERVATERARLVKEKKLRKREIPVPPSGDEIPHELPAGWEWTRLSNIGEVGPRNDVDDTLEVSFLPMATIDDGYSGAISPEFRTWGEIKKGFTHVADGDVAMAKITPCFQNRKSAVMRGLANGVGAGTTELHVVRPIADSIVPEYARLQLKSLTYLEVGVTKMTGSAGQKRVPKDYFADTPFPLPPLAEQHRIVSKVDELMGLCDRLEAVQELRRGVRVRLNRSSLDRLASVSGVGARQRGSELSAAWQRVCDHFEVLYDTPETLPDLRQTILQLAVQGKLVPQDPNDEPGKIIADRIELARQELISSGKLSKTKRLPELKSGDADYALPQDWKWGRLGNLISLLDSGWSPACENTPTRDESEWGVLKTTAVQSVQYISTHHKRLPDNLKPRPAAEVHAGDLLITRAGPKHRVGISCAVVETRPRLMISDKIIRFHMIGEYFDPEFVVLCLNAGYSKTFLESQKSGMAESQMNVSQTKLRLTPLPVLALSEQNRVEGDASSVASHPPGIDPDPPRIHPHPTPHRRHPLDAERT